MYGDVQIRFADWIKQLPHFDSSKWTCTSEQQEEKSTVAIQNRVEIIRSEHVRFISELARYNNEVITNHVNFLGVPHLILKISPLLRPFYNVILFVDNYKEAF